VDEGGGASGLGREVGAACHRDRVGDHQVHTPGHQVRPEADRGLGTCSGRSATCIRPHPQPAACRSCWTTLAVTSGMSTCWWQAYTPRSRAAARSCPHSHIPTRRCGTVSSGVADQARCAPGAPFCLPGRRTRPCPGAAGPSAAGYHPGRRPWTVARPSSCCYGRPTAPTGPPARSAPRRVRPAPRWPDSAPPPGRPTDA
jgi:hypothetical protein